MFKGIINKLLPVWNIGFVDPESILKPDKLKIRWMKHNVRDRWWADPFILDVTDRHIILLVEEFVIKTQKGHIAQLTVDKNDYSLIESKIILELDTHLSFPFIFRKDKEVYILPENFITGKSTIYRFDIKESKLISTSVICDAPLTDAIIVPLNGKHYLFSTQYPTQDGSILDIREFDAESLKCGDIISQKEFKVNIARNGGAVFEMKGETYRVAQDCNTGYGKGIIIQRLINKEDINTLDFEKVVSHYPHKNKYHIGLHTFNSYKGIAVVDGRGYKRPLTSLFMRLLPEERIKRIISFLYTLR